MSGNVHVAELAARRLYEAEGDSKTVARALGVDPASLMDFTLNVNPLGPPPSAILAARVALAQANAYPDLHLSELRRRLSERHGVSPDALLFGCGLDEVIKLVIHAWTAEFDLILLHIPTFPRYELEVRARGAVPVLVRSDPPWTTSVSRIDEALSESRPALAFLCTPNNPTGAEIACDDIRRLVDSHPDTVFVVDEALAFPLTAAAIPLVSGRRNLAVMRTFSKYWGLAGLRVGYMVADPSLIRSAELIRPPFNVALPSAAAACAALDDEGYLARAHEHFAAEAAFFRGALAAIDRCEILGAAGNMLLLSTDGMTAPDACAALARRNVLVVDAQSFNGLEECNAVRVSLRSRADNVALIDAIRGILS